MNELPDHNEMLLSAQRNLSFLLKTFYLHFSQDWELTKTPAIDETDEQRIKRLLFEKEIFLQTGLVILFNSAEIYLKSIIAEKSVFLLLKDLKDSYKKHSFFDCLTIEAADLNNVASSISGVTFPQRFNDTYVALRKERNKVIHLGKSNSKAVIKDFLSAFLTLQEEINKVSLLKLSEGLFSHDGLEIEGILASAQDYSNNIIDIYKTFFPLDEILKEIYKLDSKPKMWIQCSSCHSTSSTLAVISKAKAVCLACGYKKGVM
ncbi:TPA: hypothetical protein ACOEFP_003174 [Enterobacter bugandensis]|uniref:Uncharacterized protein n=1 Tax=Enterobacter bugandensis TaxID=881260 RepID=A0A822WY36_9ENTR|nr:hypothetical protein [Enterobacter bugandensis]MCK7399542.1 hypothetical protein [Enterobacter bugandensis]QCE27051.1 hypothetical protein FAI37_06215 [Enterobacter bugandensis]CZX74092.1 Uncharacterised protein [Enterobacter bugandensis]